MFYALLVAYVAGGLTFVPLLLAVFVYVVLSTSPRVETDPAARTSVEEEKGRQDAEVKASLERDAGVPRLYKAAWLTVRRTYEPVQMGDGTYMGMISQGYRSFLDNRSKDPKRTRPKDLFYVVLKQNVLFLYEDETQVDCAAAIEVTLHDVSLYPEPANDGELYVKRRAVRLMARGANPSVDAAAKDGSDDQVRGRPMPWYVFSKNNAEKEDWYHSLIASSKLADDDAAAMFAKDASLFLPDDMAKLVEGIDNQPDPIPMRWLNALVGRIFLSAYRTDALESWIIGRLMKKLTRVKTPTFLSGIQVREVNVGSSTPFFSKPMLKELTVDGDASMEIHVNYKGSFRITIETVATINLGARFKPYTVNLVLAVIVREVEGNLLVKIKRPPTNRIWYGFTRPPRMVLQVEPVVSTRQIKWSMILKPIESRIREIVIESFVVPNLDDLSFFPTKKYEHWGGIWGDAARREVLVSADAQAAASAGAADEAKSKADEGEEANGDADGGESSGGDTLAPEREKLAAGSSSVSLSSTKSAPGATETVKRRPWFGSSARTTSASSTPPRPTGSLPTEGQEDAAAKLREVLRSRSEAPKVVASSSIDDILSGQRSMSRSTPMPSVGLPEEAGEDGAEAGRSRSTSASHAELRPPAFIHTDSSSSLASGSSSSVAASNASGSRTASPSPGPSMVHRVPPQPNQMLSPESGLGAPPPRRHAPSQSVDSATARSASPGGGPPGNPSASMLSQWRTRATDKEAIAAGVTQAKDTMKKWGAAWQARRRQPSGGQPHFTNGFNPIDVDALEADRPQPSPDLMDMRGPPAKDKSPIGSRRASMDSTDTGGSGAKSYREHRAAVAKKARETSTPTMGTESPDPGTPSPSSSPVKESGFTAADAAARARRKSTSRSSVVSFSVDDSPKRGKGGQFLPAAPQSTRSLSVSAAKLDHPSSLPSSPPTSPNLGARSVEAVGSPRSHAASFSSSASSSYKPAPSMTVPGIKDSTHRFAMGSESSSSSAGAGTGRARTASPKPASSAVQSSPVPIVSKLDDAPSLAASSKKVPAFAVDLPSPPPPAATELPASPQSVSRKAAPSLAAAAGQLQPSPIAEDDGEDGEPASSHAASAAEEGPPKKEGDGLLQPEDELADSKVSIDTVRPPPTSKTQAKEDSHTGGAAGGGQEAEYGEAWGLEL